MIFIFYRIWLTLSMINYHYARNVGKVKHDHANMEFLLIWTRYQASKTGLHMYVHASCQQDIIVNLILAQFHLIQVFLNHLLSVLVSCLEYFVFLISVITWDYITPSKMSLFICFLPFFLQEHIQPSYDCSFHYISLLLS